MKIELVATPTRYKHRISHLVMTVVGLAIFVVAAVFAANAVTNEEFWTFVAMTMAGGLSLGTTLAHVKAYVRYEEK